MTHIVKFIKSLDVYKNSALYLSSYRPNSIFRHLNLAFNKNYEDERIITLILLHLNTLLPAGQKVKLDYDIFELSDLENIQTKLSNLLGLKIWTEYFFTIPNNDFNPCCEDICIYAYHPEQDIGNIPSVQESVNTSIERKSSHSSMSQGSTLLQAFQTPHDEGERSNNCELNSDTNMEEPSIANECKLTSIEPKSVQSTLSRQSSMESTFSVANDDIHNKPTELEKSCGQHDVSPTTKLKLGKRTKNAEKCIQPLKKTQKLTNSVIKKPDSIVNSTNKSKDAKRLKNSKQKVKKLISEPLESAMESAELSFRNIIAQNEHDLQKKVKTLTEGIAKLNQIVFMILSEVYEITNKDIHKFWIANSSFNIPLSETSDICGKLNKLPKKRGRPAKGVQ